MKLVVKTYIVTEDGEKAFGYGPLHLLEGTARAGSLRKAAAQDAMAYPKALAMVKRGEVAFHCKFLHTTTGGKGGGGSVLTQEAQEVMDKYAQLKDDVERYAQERFTALFDEPQ